MPSTPWRSTSLVGCSLLLAACGGASPPPEPPPPPPVTPAASAPVAAPVVAPPAVAAAPEPKKPEQVFFPVIEVTTDVMLHAVAGAVIVSTVLPDEPDRAVGVIENDKLLFPPQLRMKDLGTFNSLHGVTGKWPESLDAFLTGSSGRIGRADHIAYGAKGWKATSGRESQLFLGAATIAGTTFAALGPAMPYIAMPPSIVAVRGSGRAPKLTPRNQAACADALKLTGDERKELLKRKGDAEVAPAGMGATRAGTLAIVGLTCRGVAFETWPAGAKISIITDIPGDPPLDDAFTQIVPGAGDEAWAFLGRPFHYDGKTWSERKDAPKMRTGAAQRDGTLWAVGDDGKVYKGGVAGFTQVPVPGDVPAAAIVVADDDTVWLLAGNSILRTKRAADGAPSIAVKELPKKPARAQPLVPGSAKCAKNMVLLYGFTKVTPDDFDFPKTREAVTGHTELADVHFQVTKENDKKYFTAMVSSFDQGKKLVTLIESKVKGSKPALLCTDRSPPDVVRELKIDLKTGAVVK